MGTYYLGKPSNKMSFLLHNYNIIVQSNNIIFNHAMPCMTYFKLEIKINFPFKFLHVRAACMYATTQHEESPLIFLFLSSSLFSRRVKVEIEREPIDNVRCV